MRLLWICGLPKAVRDAIPGGTAYSAHSDWSWIVGHLPPPPDVELHIACPVTRGPWSPPPIDFAGARFHLVRCLPGRLQTGYLLDPLYYRRLHARLRPDAIHAWGTEDAYSIVAESLDPTRCVVQVQGLLNAYLPHMKGGPGLRFAAWRERVTLRNARTVFVESAYSASITRPFCGTLTRIVQVDHPLRSEFLSTRPSDGSAPQVLFLGSLCERKGYREAVRAFCTGAPEEWRMLLMGGGDAAETDELKRLVAESRQGHRIRHEAQASPSHIAECMRQSSVFLLPSKMDTGPTALKEALAMGLWPLCYDNSGPGEYIRRYGYGSLVPTGDTAGFARALATLVREQPWQSTNRREELVRRVRIDLSAKTIWPQLLEHYAGVSE